MENLNVERDFLELEYVVREARRMQEAIEVTDLVLDRVDDAMKGPQQRAWAGRSHNATVRF